MARSRRRQVPDVTRPARLLHAARRLESLDARRARETYLQAWWAALLAGQFAPPDQLLEISRAARALPPPADPMPCDLLVDGLATLITEGRTAARPVLRGQSTALSKIGYPTTTGSSGVAVRPPPPFALWDFESWIELSTRQVDRARASGALTSLVLSLNFHANMLAYCGDLEGAASAVAEQEAAREATGIRIVSYGARLVAAHQGHLAEMSAQTAAIEDELMKSSDGYALQVATLATALLNNGLGRYAKAIAAAQEHVRRIHVPWPAHALRNDRSGRTRWTAGGRQRRVPKTLRDDRRRLGLGRRHRGAWTSTDQR